MLFYVTQTKINLNDITEQNTNNMDWIQNNKNKPFFFSFFLSLSFVFIAERQYGCYRLGVFAAIIIVLLLILGTIPVTLILKNNQIVLICLCTTLLVVAILLSVFCVWQQKQVKRQRARSSLPYIIQRQNKVFNYHLLSFYLLLSLFIHFAQFHQWHLILTEWNLYSRTNNICITFIVAFLAAFQQEWLYRSSITITIYST